MSHAHRHTQTHTQTPILVSILVQLSVVSKCIGIGRKLKEASASKIAPALYYSYLLYNNFMILRVDVHVK